MINFERGITKHMFPRKDKNYQRSHHCTSEQAIFKHNVDLHVYISQKVVDLISTYEQCVYLPLYFILIKLGL